MKHLIKIESVAHGVLGVKHAGLDQQYCEAGELVILKWQPDAGWGLQEAHYTDGDGHLTAIEGGEFTMPDKDITIGGTFKRFVVRDWTGVGQKGEAMMVGDNGEPIPNNNVTMSAEGDVTAKGTVTAEGDVTAEGTVMAEGDVTAGGEVTAGGLIHVYGQFGIIFHTQDGDYSLSIDNGQLRVDPYNP